MSKAENAALEAYPSTPNWDERIIRMYRGGFIKGYHQAEKDLELTWEDIKDILNIYEEVTNMDFCHDIYEEVLKRFNKLKKKQL